MKTTKLAIPSEHVMSLVLASALEYELKAGWVKVYGANGPKGPRVYVNRAPTVRDFHIAAFDTQGPTDPAFKKFGDVRAQLPTAGLSADSALELFASLLQELAAIPLAPPRPSAPKAKKEQPAPAPVDPVAQARRLELIRKTAEKMGVPVSPMAHLTAEISAEPVALADSSES